MRGTSYLFKLIIHMRELFLVSLLVERLPPLVVVFYGRLSLDADRRLHQAELLLVRALHYRHLAFDPLG